MQLAARADAPRRLTVRAIEDVSSWQALAEEWDRVLLATAGHTPLQSFDFLSTWWACMHADRTPLILAFEDGEGRLAGVAPLQITPRRLLGKRYRVLEFLAMTEDILVPTVLFPSADREQLRGAFIQYLAEHRDRWDWIELDELKLDDGLIEDLRQLAKRCNLIHREQPFHDCPYLDLSGQTLDSYMASRSRKMLKNLRAAERKLAAVGKVSVQVYRTEQEVGAGVREFFAVEQHSWKRRECVGMSSDDRYPVFYGRLLEAFAKRHEARVLVLRCGERAIAATMAIVLGGIYCSLQIVHDEREERFSPGTLLELYEMEELLRAGTVRRYEFLGGALTNKLRWTSTAERTCCIRLRQPDLRARLLDSWEVQVKPAIKWVLRRIGVFKKPVHAQPSSS